jgi:hypothetical protein
MADSSDRDGAITRLEQDAGALFVRYTGRVVDFVASGIVKPPEIPGEEGCERLVTTECFGMTANSSSGAGIVVSEWSCWSTLTGES